MVLSILNRYGLLHENTQFSDSNIKVHCPFHDEYEPSFSVNVEDGRFLCFGCGESGSLQKLIMKIEKVNSLQASMILQKYKNEKVVIKKDTRTRKEKLRGAYIQYASLPILDWENKKYRNNYMIKERGFKPQILNKFKVRLEESEDYPILIPIFDNGEYKGNLFRRIDKIEYKKYLNSKGFHKKESLGGTYNNEFPVLVVEGYLDMMKARQFGYKNSCCLFGCEPSDQQIEKLKKHTDKLIVALDNTPQGRKGTEKLKKHFKIKRFRFQYNNKDIGDIESQNVFNKCLYDTLKKKKRRFFIYAEKET